MSTQRPVVDYSLTKRAVLRDFQRGLVAMGEICDSSPYLRNAARFHGEQTELRCPVCRRENLTYVRFAYGEALRQSAGQARRPDELSLLAATVDEFQVYLVEVCRGCGWNHLIEQYLLGTRVTGSNSPRRIDVDINERPERYGRVSQSARRDGAVATAGCDE
ncbi:DUF5318 family protein [Pilimelia columellifera]|uniref:DUF5318 domain-containing protein n=1 Tax=Pilimelia columellifera subsp. columellifera TaxID=706583 RepID=A0ABP6ABK6_9ACTN